MTGGGALYGLHAVAAKETLHIRRDPTSLFFALLIPMMQLMLFGFAIDFDVRHVRTAVVDYDHSRESREYIQSLVNTHYLDVVEMLDSPAAAADAVRRNEVRVAVIIPPDFARRYGSVDKPQVSVMIDGSDSQVANPARLAVLRPQPQSADVEARVEMLYNPTMRTQVYTIPGLLGVILQLVTVSLTSFSLVRERESGTLEQLMVTPVGRLAIMLGKLLPYSALAMCELLLVVVVGRLVFNVPLQGSFVLLVALSLPFVVAALSIGLFISSVAQNQAQALQMTMLTTLPSILLSGYIAPRETLPGPLYVLSNMIPVTYFIQIARGVMVRGAGLADLWWPALMLCVIAVVLIGLATSRFRKSND
jgi:ABC-type multidrug transport system permease subunit